ncbi:L-fucose/L-arabinose isomerase family protein [Desulfopila aestuarii]|uniref:L-fucose isomerase n=1 Tax=Desulfopila aestuarii DSM 18488 TaxID=1121416 RepID=A0A1M7XVU1_9BACT|nr:fucose isomerase [Desulfopila aestuarii]SHO42816.1 L-fucose isomerase [Desulfopila aestuarii DSM 18488]
MKIIDKKSCLGVIVGTRGFFNPILCGSARKELLASLDALSIDYVIAPEDATPHGAVETIEHARLYARLFRENAERIDGVLVILPNFGDELGIVQTLDLAKLGVPVMVQACNDDVDKVDVFSRRDAFCGKISVCNNLYQYGIPITDTTLHTCDIKSPEFQNDLKRFAAICRTVKGLSCARIGAIGARPAAFQTVRYSEKILQAHGITVVPVDLSEIFAAAAKYDDDAQLVKEKLAEIKAYGNIPARIPSEQILRQTKFSVAVNDWMARNECVASAIQCWTSMQDNYGCASCLTMSMMGENSMPSACEVDVTGAVSMYALLLASGNPPGFLDWNNNYGSEENKCVNTHCSNFPKGFMGITPEIADLDILGETLGRENCFGAVKGHVASGPMTYFRISTDDPRGKIKSYLGQGKFTDDPFNMDGGIAVCKVPELRKLLAHICQNGFEHHVAMVRGQVADILEESIGKYLGWDLFHNR